MTFEKKTGITVFKGVPRFADGMLNDDRIEKIRDSIRKQEEEKYP